MISKLDSEKMLDCILRQLPDIYREVLQYRYIYQFTVAETAESLSISEAAVAEYEAEQATAQQTTTEQAGTESDNSLYSEEANAVFKVGDVVPGNFSDCTITVDKVDVFDSVAEFDRTNFYMGFDYDSYIGEDGRVLPYERKTIIPGNGVDILPTYSDPETIQRKFVYVTVTIENPTDVDNTDFAMTGQIRYFEKAANGHLKDTFCCYIESNYFDASNTNSLDTHFFYTTVGAGETVTCHVGYFVDEDMLDKMYLETHGISSEIIYLIDINQ